VGLSQAAVARRLGLGQSTLADIETGRRPARFSEVLQLLDVLGIELADLDVRGRPPEYAVTHRGTGRPRRIKVPTEFHSTTSMIEDAEEALFVLDGFEPLEAWFADADRLMPRLLAAIEADDERREAVRQLLRAARVRDRNSHFGAREMAAAALFIAVGQWSVDEVWFS